MGVLMFAQKISPETKRAWQPPIEGTEQQARNNGGNASTTRAEDGRDCPKVLPGLKRPRTEAQGGGSCAGKKNIGGRQSATQDKLPGSRGGVMPSLPAAGADFSKWLVKNLRSFLQVCD